MKYTQNDLNLLKYAINSGVLEYVDAGASIEQSYESNGYLNLKFSEKLIKKDRDIADKVVTVNFGSDTPDNAEADFLRILRLKLPVIEVLDLVTIALNKGIIKNEQGDSLQNSIMYSEFNGEYNALTSYDGYFTFSIADDSGIKTLYNVTFNRKVEFVRNLNVEYLSRSSMFIKAILDRVMYKYNILIVAKAMLSEDSVPPLPLAEGFEQLGSGRLEDSDDVIENEIHGQIKVLISYRDTINNESYSERVIDDIYVDNVDTDNPEFSVSNIHPSDYSEGVPNALNDIPAGEREAIQSIHKLFSRDDIKFKIFEKLRESPYTALRRLIDRRFSDYVKTNDGFVPKVEFTLTPIAIYSNHIVRNIKRYKIAFKNPPESLKGFTVEYEKVIEPNRSLYHEITTESGETVVLTPDKPLVIALRNNFNNHPPVAVNLPLDPDYVVRLDKNNQEFYGGAKFSNVYFDKSVLVPGKETGYAGCEDKYFLADDLATCEETHKKYHVSDLERVDGGSITSAGFLDKRGVGKYVYRRNIYTCPICHSRFSAATKKYWETYSSKNVLDNGTGKADSCCDKCIGLIRDNQVILKDNSVANRFYTDNYTDGQLSKRTVMCPCCLTSSDAKTLPEDMTVDTKRKLTKTDKAPDAKHKSRKNDDIRTVCKVCGKTVCKAHFVRELGVCKSCKSPSDSSETFGRRHELWKSIKRYLRIPDRFCKDMVIDEKSSKLGEVRLFLKKRHGTIVYYMYRTGGLKECFAVRNIQKLTDE